MEFPIIAIIIGVIVLLLIIFLIIFAVGLSKMVAWPHIISIPDEINYEKEKGMWRNYEEYQKEEFLLESYDGYKLNAIYVPAKEKSDKYVVISHGYSGCRLGSVKYLHLFHELGFNAVMYDDRGHGSNERTYCTMGFRESRDLLTVINYVYDRFGEDITLGLHGESMGSGLTNTALKYSPKVSFVVSDCGYCDLPYLLKYLVNKTLHLPGFLEVFASLATRIMYGYFFGRVRPIEQIKENEIPICFFHGEDDDFIPCEHAKRLHEANKGYSELHLVPGAGHAMSIITDEESYTKHVKEFLVRIGIIEK
ncbi:MAG: alpha/beta hydrolase [Lachnospiraceae bacterium]|nr:alpha/beta hydrolase [Lachnospiraceae bacterium]